MSTYYKDPSTGDLLICDDETGEVRVAQKLCGTPKKNRGGRPKGSVAATPANDEGQPRKAGRIAGVTETAPRKEQVAITPDLKEKIKVLKDEGLTSGDIAQKLGISLSSVNRYWV